MGCKEVLLLFLIQTIAIFLAEEDVDSTFSRSSYFTTRENKQLKGYVVKRFDSPSLLSCGQQCMRNAWCTSTNYKMASKKDGKGTCELNKHDISLTNENNTFLHDEIGVTLALLLKGCLTTGCLNGGSCLPDNEKQTFTCSCHRPWTGAKCEDLADLNSSTCKEIYDKNLSKQNSAYLLKVGSEKTAVFCYMTRLGACGGGGWTLAIKMNGAQKTFHFDSKLWSNNESFNLEAGKTGFDLQETKLPTYWNTPFSKICLGMKIGQQNKFIAFNKSASSLYSLIADGKYHNTSLGRDTWKSLIGSQASLQTNCNREGFNVVSDSGDDWPKARIGILGNNQNDCYTCDSRIGFGTGGYPDNATSCGNSANGLYTAVAANINATGYILVQ